MTSVSQAASDARRLLRQWLARSDSDILLAVDELGRQAIRAAAQASERLERTAGGAASASGVLQELQALAQTYAPVPAPRARSWFGAPSPASTPVAPDLGQVVASLERERDAIARALIGIETNRSKLEESEAGLESALALIRACATAVEAAARELSVDQPGRAAFLRDAVALRLLERERDVLTQAAVTRQGVLALQLVADGQAALAQAIERARDNSIAALRTAAFAKAAIEGQQDALCQAEALERTAEAERTAPAASQENVERALGNAVDQLRRAIDAAQSTRRR